MAYVVTSSIEMARSRHGAYTGCSGGFTLQDKVGMFDEWRCHDCGTVVKVSDMEDLSKEHQKQYQRTTVTEHPKPQDSSTAIVNAMNKARWPLWPFRGMTREQAELHGWSGTSWVWCGGCQNHGECPHVTCTNHKNAPQGHAT